MAKPTIECCSEGGNVLVTLSLFLSFIFMALIHAYMKLMGVFLVLYNNNNATVVACGLPHLYEAHG